GPMRELASRLREVDFIVTQGGLPHPGEWLMQFIAGDICNLRDPSQKLLAPPKFLPHQPNFLVHAVAGIGNPQRFFDQLRRMGFAVVEHAFPDHHVYSRQDIDFGADAIVIMTDKDAVKCEKFADSRHWRLPITASCEVSFFKAVLAKVK